MNPPDPGWIEARRAGACRALRRAVSATGLERHRAGFGWTVRPAPGSILASTRVAAWDPDPDYFHHWVRDAAVVMRVLPEIIAAEPAAREWWMQAFRDHVAFSLAISDPARRGPSANPLMPTTRADHLRFLRPDAELAALHGAAWLEEPRFAPDGAPDPERWSRPQDDGPALRASCCLRVVQAIPELASPGLDSLIARDLDHLARIAGRPAIGPWEEEPPRRTTFSLIAAWDALDRGSETRPEYRAAAARVVALAVEARDADGPLWRESVEAPPGAVDSATLLAILHAERADGPFAMTAPEIAGTLAALEAVFTEIYPINRGRSEPALGRWRDDVFFDGNPWFPVTLGVAEMHYRIATLTGSEAAFRRAEGWMALVAEVAPEGDDLPEQFHRATGAPVSCRALSWSAAAFIGAAAARDQAMASR